MAEPNKSGQKPDHAEEKKSIIDELPSYTPQNQTDQEGELKKVAREAPSYTPQGRTDNA